MSHHDDPPASEAAPGDGNRRNWVLASAQWSSVRPPLKPGPADIGFSEAWIQRRSAELGRAPRAVLLGVTPELAGCAWPPGTRLRAIDISQAMIDSLWPAPGLPEDAAAICADWRAMPLPDGDADLMVGDGCFALLPYPAEGRRFCAEARRVLAPGGLIVTRVFLRPDQSESLAEIQAELAAGRIGSVHVLKWRLAAAVQPSAAQGARLGDIYAAWGEIEAAAATSLGRPGWSPDEVASLQRYRDNPACYIFHSRAEFEGLIAPDFELVEVYTGAYELGERCPSYVLRRRDQADG